MFKNKKNKIISFLICFLFIVSLISIKTSKVEADGETRTEPSFELTYLVGKTENNETKVKDIVNQDFLIEGEVKGLEFELNYPDKELVLVLDTSESMNESVKGSSDNCKIDSKGNCKTHSVDGNDKSKKHPINYENSKIYKLKEAAEAFVEKFEKTNNLKIAIVSYNNDATIETEGYIESNKTDDLKKIINNLEAGEGTNTGEGLRNALYLFNLNATKDINRTIVLMSDGLPTYCTVEQTELNDNKPVYYQDITKKESKIIWNSGSGLSDVYGFDIGYANLMASKVNDNKYNAYTIGYGLNDSGNMNLKTIHKEMVGLADKENVNNDDIQIDESLGYYEANDEVDDKGNIITKDFAIIDVFNKIAEDLIEQYEIMDANIEMTGINEEIFTLNIEGNTMPLEGLKYTIKEIKDSKVIYHSEEPVKFSYTLKGDRVLKDISLYNKTSTDDNDYGIKINYNWKGNKLKSYPKERILITLTTKAKELYHGLYNGMVDGIPSIDENGAKAFAVTPGATYTFGATFMVDSKIIDAKLNVDKNISIKEGDIKAYKVENGILIPLRNDAISAEGASNNEYNINLDGDKDGITSTTKILIVYKGQVNNDLNNKIDLSNKITISDSSKEVKMQTPSIDTQPKLPDLF